MAKINIDELSEAELIDLNHRIVERLRFLSQMRAHSEMLDFKIGERVTLQFQAQAFNLLNTQYRGAPDPVIDDVTLGPPPAFNSTAYNFNGGGNNLEGGGNSSANLTYDGIGRRRLLFGLKLLF